MSWTDPVRAGGGVLAGDVLKSCSTALGAGFPRRSIGRLGSFSNGSVAGAGGVGGEGAEAAGGVAVDVDCGVVGDEGGSGDFGFSEFDRRNTGGVSLSSSGFEAAAGFLATAAAISDADCHLPSPIHVFFPRKTA